MGGACPLTPFIIFWALLRGALSAPDRSYVHRLMYMDLYSGSYLLGHQIYLEEVDMNYFWYPFTPCKGRSPRIAVCTTSMSSRGDKKSNAQGSVERTRPTIMSPQVVEIHFAFLNAHILVYLFILTNKNWFGSIVALRQFFSITMNFSGPIEYVEITALIKLPEQNAIRRRHKKWATKHLISPWSFQENLDAVAWVKRVVRRYCNLGMLLSVATISLFLSTTPKWPQSSMSYIRRLEIYSPPDMPSVRKPRFVTQQMN